MGQQGEERMTLAIIPIFISKSFARPARFHSRRPHSNQIQHLIKAEFLNFRVNLYSF